MATQFCQKYKSHPGRTCDYDDQGECAETAEVQDSAEDKCVTRSSRTDEEPRGSDHQCDLPSALVSAEQPQHDLISR